MASADKLPWKRAELTAAKLFFSGETDLTLEEGGPGEVVLHLESRFVGRRAESRVRIDRATGATLERITMRHGGDPYRKTYTFGPEGVTEHRISPLNDREKDKGPGKWSKVHERVHPAPAGCSDLVHSEGLFWLLATQTPAPGEPALERCAFTGDGFVRVSLVALERREETPDFDVAGENPSAGPRSILVVRLDGRALDGAATEDLDFLGLEGDITLRVDEATGAPVRVTGSISPLGTVHVRLDHLEL